jgi:hypothetical protein
MPGHTPTWIAICDVDGQIHVDSPRGFKAWCKATLANKQVVIEVKPRFRKASRKQHGYWRAYVVPTIAKHLGYLPSEHDAVHDELMRVLCGLKEDADPRLQIRKSSADFSTADFNEWLIEQVQVWAATKLGIVLDDPNPDWRAKPAQRRTA